MTALSGFTGSSDAKLTHLMSSSLSHRAQNGHSSVESTHLSVSLAHSMPEATRTGWLNGVAQSGDLSIALSGYIINRDEIKRYATELSVDLIDDGLGLLFALYRRVGIEFVTQLKGGFCLALGDRDELYLVRDGAGVQTVYYANHGKRFLFASEPKSILSAPGFPRVVERSSIAKYMTFSFVPGSPTMLSGVSELTPGSWLHFRNGQSSIHRYFRFEESEYDQEQDVNWPLQLRQTLARAVARRIPRGQPLALFLSGGLDSSVVTAELADQYDGQLDTFAIHFGPAYPNELEFARLVADRCRTNHHEVLIRPEEFLPRMRKMIWSLDDPIGDPITLPNFELSSIVSQNTPWIFNGEGGDPCLGGPKNLPMLIQHWYGTGQTESFREDAYLSSYRRSYEEISYLLSPDLQSEFNQYDHLHSILRPFFMAERPRYFLNKLMAINMRLKGAHLILPKVERMTNSAGITAMAPLFDEDVIRLSMRMPPRSKLNRGIEKYALKEAYRALLPQAVIDRPKSGMRVPVHFWFQKEMKKYARKILSKRAIRRAGLFDYNRVKQLLDYSTEEGPGRYGIRLWMLLTFEMWRRIVIEREAV